MALTQHGQEEIQEIADVAPSLAYNVAELVAELPAYLAPLKDLSARVHNQPTWHHLKTRQQESIPPPPPECATSVQKALRRNSWITSFIPDLHDVIDVLHTLYGVMDSCRQQ